jgi:hypothetical protein
VSVSAGQTGGRTGDPVRVIGGRVVRGVRGGGLP